MGLYEVGWPEVPHPAQQVEGPVPHGHQRLVTKHDGLSSVGRLGELGEHNTSHTGLNIQTWIHNIHCSIISWLAAESLTSMNIPITL